MTTESKLGSAPVDLSRAAHPFERSGLGKAPFRVVGYERRVFQACQGAPIQVGGSCDHCGTGIIHTFIIQGADGGKFKVGSSCVFKTGDSILSGMVRQYQKNARRAENAARKAELAATLEARRAEREAEHIETALYQARKFARENGIVDAIAAWERHEILRDLKLKLEQYGELSIRQVDLVKSLFAQLSEKKCNAPSGRVTFTGKVVSAKYYTGAYGSQLKATIKVETPEGRWMCFGSVPTGVLQDVSPNGNLKGSVVSITATVIPKEDDPTFANFKRPTKGEALSVSLQYA